MLLWLPHQQLQRPPVEQGSWGRPVLVLQSAHCLERPLPTRHWQLSVEVHWPPVAAVWLQVQQLLLAPEPLLAAQHQ